MQIWADSKAHLGSLSWHAGFRCAERPPEFDGLVVPSAMIVFQWLRRSQPTHWVRCILRSRTVAARIGYLDPWIVRLVDIWVALGPVVALAVILLMPDEPRLRLDPAGIVLVVFLTWRVVGIFEEAWNVTLLDALRREKPMWSSPRTMVLGWINLVEIVLIFTVLFQFAAGGFATEGSGSVGMMWSFQASLGTALLFGLPSASSGTSVALVAGEVVVTTSLLLMLLAWVAGGLDKRTPSG
jgi:hypothetical protein